MTYSVKLHFHMEKKERWLAKEATGRKRGQQGLWSSGRELIEGSQCVPHAKYWCEYICEDSQSSRWGYLEAESWQLDFFLISLKHFATHPSSFFSLTELPDIGVNTHNILCVWIKQGTEHYEFCLCLVWSIFINHKDDDSLANRTRMEGKKRGGFFHSIAKIALARAEGNSSYRCSASLPQCFFLSKTESLKASPSPFYATNGISPMPLCIQGWCCCWGPYWTFSQGNVADFDAGNSKQPWSAHRISSFKAF